MSIDTSASAPWLSVIIPSYKGELWIDAALSSIAAEAAEGVEVLLIDGGPTNATLEIAKRYASRLNLRTFECRDLASWHTKTNFGVKMARSSHICWLGVDDVWLPGRAAAVRAWIAAAREAPLHLAPSAIIDQHGRRLGIWRCPLSANRALTSFEVIERLLVQNFVAAPAPVFRKDAWLICGGLDEGLWYTADWDIWLKLAGLGHAHYHDVVTIGFRIHTGALTVTGSGNSADFENQMKIVLDRHLLKLHEPSERLRGIANASISVNAAFAAASNGDHSRLRQAVLKIMRLGPVGIFNYLRYSRIFERLAPRLRAKLTGAL
jgi:glycosyltransferase involved in cell wall biosynthesis